jgi:hypothetical protein
VASTVSMLVMKLILFWVVQLLGYGLQAGVIL